MPQHEVHICGFEENALWQGHIHFPPQDEAQQRCDPLTCHQLKLSILGFTTKANWIPVSLH